MKLTILGCHSAIPRTHRNPTAQVLDIRNHTILIDCAEGTQVALRKNKVRFSQINHIFISHLHGDHYFGLIGLISSFQLLSRTKDLHIYGPKGLKEIILLQLKLAGSWTKFQLRFHELRGTNSELIFEDDTIEVKTIPLKHRIYTNGFLFTEKAGERKLNYQRAIDSKIDVSYFKKLKQGFDVVNSEGKLIKNNTVTLDPTPMRSYAFCSDTIYDESVAEIVKGVDILYHESTFLEKNADLATPTMHSTAKEAAKIAQLAEVKKLILGHFSTRYDDLNLFIEESKTIFKNVELAADGKIFNFE